MDTKSRIRTISLTLFVTVFSVWLLFYFIMSNYITDSTQARIASVADQIIERLGGELAEAERLSYRIKQNEDIKSLMRVQDRQRFFRASAAADAAQYTQGYSSDLIKNVIVYGADGHPYRLTGTLGNRACSILYSVIVKAEVPHHLNIALDNKQYVGYADGMELGGAGVGAVAVLIEKEKIIEILRSYDQSGSLLVMIRSGGNVIAANTENIEAYEELSMNRGRLGITPYEIWVAADTGYMDAQVVYFSIVAVITAAIFAVVLVMYTRALNTRFFRPMVGVIEGIGQLRTDTPDERLPYVHSLEFDNLIDKINDMLLHIEANNAQVRAADIRAKNAELEKQKALVFSLKKQINAHFTVNTLVAIRTAVAYGELEKAELMISGLTRLVRYAHDRDESIGIWDELDILKNYTAIMNNRYGGKMNAEFDFDDALMDCRMPRMILQPILENAILHGFKDMDSGCLLTVKARLRGQSVLFSVADNGGGMREDELRSLRSKLESAPLLTQGLENIALANIKSRLKNYFGCAARMDIDAKASGGILVTVTIPVVTERSDAL